MPDRRFPRTFLLLVPLLLAVLAYARVQDGEFVFDDFRVVKELPRVDPSAALADFPRALLHGGRPTTELTFLLDGAGGDPSPSTFHRTSLGLHLAVVILVYLLARAILRRAGRVEVDGVALVVAGIFALHPLQSEAVSYVSQRSEVLASGLYVAALLVLLLADRRGPGWKGAALGAGALALSTLGMGAKQIVVTLPVAFLLLVLVVPPAGKGGGRSPGWWRVALVLPIALVDAVLVRGILRSVEGRGDAGFSVPGSDPGSYFLTQWRAVATYVRLLAWPAGQNADWSFPLSRRLSDPAVLGAGLLLAAMLAGAVLLWWRSRDREGPAAAGARAAAFGIAWFFLLLAPTSTFVPIADVLVERRVYLAAFGLILAAVLGGEWVLDRAVAPPRRTWVAAVAVGGIWIALAVALHRRNAVWETELAYWSDAVSKSPGKARPRLGLGGALARNGDLAGAALAFQAGLARVSPDAPVLEGQLLHNLGSILVRLGRPAEALDPLERAATLDPDALAPREMLAQALWALGEAGLAEEQALEVLARSPGSALAARVVGLARMARDDDEGALPMLEQAVRAQPEDGEARYNLGAVQANLGRTADACASWRAILRGQGTDGVKEPARQGMAALACPP
jgi:tetratricopeptide (TPR) repeat protein